MGVSFMPIKGVVSEVFTASERHSAWTTRIGWIAISGRLRGVVEEDVGVWWCEDVGVVRRLIFEAVIIVWSIWLVRFDEIGWTGWR